jgi:hypothetical protein
MLMLLLLLLLLLLLSPEKQLHDELLLWVTMLLQLLQMLVLLFLNLLLLLLLLLRQDVGLEGNRPGLTHVRSFKTLCQKKLCIPCLNRIRTNAWSACTDAIRIRTQLQKFLQLPWCEMCRPLLMLLK